MLFIILVFLALCSVVLISLKRDKQTTLIFGLCISFILMFIGIIIYSAKTGGLSASQQQFLFISENIRKKLSFIPIRLGNLGYLIAMGRYLFPFFLIMIAINYSMTPWVRRTQKFWWAFLICPIISLTVYYPQIFYKLVRNRFVLQRAIIYFTVGWIIFYLIISVALLIHEYRSITILFCKRQFRFILILVLSITIIYCFYCIQDPIQVYQLYTAEYLWFSGMAYSNPSLAITSWVIITVIMVLATLFGFFNLYKYTQLDYLNHQEQATLKRKFDAASQGASIFVHSIKNQLLATRVLHKKIDKEISADNNVTGENVKGYINQLNQMNEDMLEHINELYKNFKTNSIMLSPVLVFSIVDKAVASFKEKYPEVNITTLCSLDEQVLADEKHLTEAVYNLLINAKDALDLSNSKEPKIEVIIHNERLYVVIEVKDNGGGISKNEQSKIFEPFYTSKNTNSNWGMGLYHVQQTIKNHFGYLRVESKIGEGTSFLILLPRYTPHRRK